MQSQDPARVFKSQLTPFLPVLAIVKKKQYGETKSAEKLGKIKRNGNEHKFANYDFLKKRTCRLFHCT